MLINADNLRTLRTALNAAFNGGFNEQAAGIDDYWAFTEDVISPTGDEEYGWLDDIQMPRKWEGDRFIANVKQNAYRLIEEPYERTIGVKRRHIETDRYGLYAKRFQLMGKAARRHPASMMFDQLLNGFSRTCFDGQYFFDTDHPVAGGVVSNMQAGAGAAWFLLDTRNFVKPLILQRAFREYIFESKEDANQSDHVFNRDEFLYGIRNYLVPGYGFWQLAFGSKAALDATNFGAAYNALMGMTNDNGEKLGVTPSLLVVGPGNREPALNVVKRERDTNGASNINYQAVDVLVTPWLP